MAGKRSPGHKKPKTRAKRPMGSMLKIVSEVLRCRELDQLLAAVTRELARMIRFDRSSIAFLSASGDCLILRDIHKTTGENGRKYGEGRRIPLSEKNVLGWVALNRKPLLRNNIKKDRRFEDTVKEEPLLSEMIVPLEAGEELLGTLNVGSYSENAFSRSDLQMLIDYSEAVCIAIEHLLLVQEAKELSQRHKVLQEKAHDVMLLVDRHSGKIVEANPRAEEMLGYPLGELEGKPYLELFGGEDLHQARKDFINLLSKKSVSFLDRRMVSKDDRVIFVDIGASLISIKDKEYAQLIIHDNSARKLLEEQIISRNRYLQELNRKLVEVDRMKTEFLANISHELRTPLSVILAYAEAMRSPDIPHKERADFAEVIAENGEILLRLINDLLDLSRLEASGTRLNMNLSHIHDVIKAIWPGMEREARKKQIDISFHPGEDIPVSYFDNEQIVKVMSCLIGNAVKFTAEGGNVCVATHLQDGEIHVEVVDTGVGIPESQISEIFDSFHQLDGSSTRKWGGLGIGLAIAKHIVELHKGRIWVESREGEGSKFTFSLPLAREDVLTA